MKYYMLNPYRDIPRYAEVEMIGPCHDSGCSRYQVVYNGGYYTPPEEDVVNSLNAHIKLKQLVVKIKND